MRRFADTLPTLRESAPSRSPLVVDGQRFDPAILTRLIAERKDAAPAGAMDADAAPRVIPFTPGMAPPESPAPEPRKAARSPIPPLDGPTNSREDEIATALAEAKTAHQAERDAAVAAARADEKARAAADLAAARTAWCEAEAAALSARFEAAFDDLHRRLSDAIGRALVPIALPVIREAALRRFASILDDLVGPSADGPAVTVTGPADLIAALRKIMGPSCGVAFAEGEDTELAATVDATRLETTIGAWAETLAEAMGPARDDA
ncbi:hypothetical protein [Acuticoccus kandeliae]|uniref:hypothetical protein n=1 Tax=Acuticoccus kandeliae TaxID=2073160 RepID=UPI000D3E9F96|nr:hypothetical protein [Acuticoccus kandeliae]